MKYLVIIFAFLFSSLPIIPQYGSNTKGYRTVSKTVVEKEYWDIDTNKWKYNDGKWFYKGQDIGISPVVYSYSVDSVHSVEDVDGIQQSVCMKQVRGSIGYYTSEELNWSWDKTEAIWRYKDHKVEAFPPTFNKVATETIKEIDCKSGKTILIKTEIKERFKVSSTLWRWDSERRIWLFDERKEERLPTYVVTESTKIKSESVL